MARIHLADTAGNPECMSVCTGKKYIVTQTQQSITCMRCQSIANTRDSVTGIHVGFAPTKIK